MAPRIHLAQGIIKRVSRGVFPEAQGLPLVGGSREWWGGVLKNGQKMVFGFKHEQDFS